MKVRRRWVQFSVRTVLVVTAVIAVILGITFQRARARRDAIRAIDELGGTYYVSVSGPEWLHRLVGDERYFWDAFIVFFRRSTHALTDDELGGVIDQLNVFQQFGYLNLASSDITDDGLKHLLRLRNIDGLCMNDTKVSDNAIQHLERLTTLKELQIVGTEITEKGVARLEQALPDCTVIKQ